MSKKIIHQLSLTGIGGVQQSFIPYFKLVLKQSKFEHCIYGMHKLDNYYNDINHFYKNIHNSFIYKILFIYYIFSKNYVIHFYNNLGSKKVNRILSLFPSSKIIFHERGTVWNASDEDKIIYQSNASKAKIIIANSQASKIMLIKRFGIEEKKIKVIYNGFLSKDDTLILKNKTRYSQRFSIGYIGRLDTPKGVHILIESAKKLPQFDFFIAGNGPWKELLVKLAEDNKNIKFIGRIKKPLEFISRVDILVVPSIREPLGNTIIEAGFCKKAVIATYVDGIAEIIENGNEGILLEPKREVSITSLPKGSVPIPKVVVNPSTQNLETPKEIDVSELSEVIKELEKNKTKRELLGNNLYKKVKKKFTVESYFNNIEKIYDII